MSKKYRKRRDHEMREKRFHMILYHNEHTIKEITLPSFFRSVPKLAAMCGLAILLYFLIRLGTANYMTYQSLHVAYQNEIQQVKTAKIMHEKIIDLRDEIQSMYTK